MIARACRQPSWDALIGAYAHAREIVHAAWLRAISSPSG
jgi:hypothetical protein